MLRLTDGQGRANIRFDIPMRDCFFSVGDDAAK
jgi:hypothetical protein